MYRSPRGIRISSSSSSPGGGGGGGGAGGSSGANPAGPTASGQSPKQSRRYWTPEDNAVRNRIGTLIHQGKKVMVIVRGLPGSGKSTLAKYVSLSCQHIHTSLLSIVWGPFIPSQMKFYFTYTY